MHIIRTHCTSIFFLFWAKRRSHLLRKAFWNRPCSRSSRPQMPRTSRWETPLRGNAFPCCAVSVSMPRIYVWFARWSWKLRCRKPSTKFLRLSPRRNSSDFINMYRRTLRLAKLAYYWGWNWGFELVRSAACNGAILTWNSARWTSIGRSAEFPVETVIQR